MEQGMNVLILFSLAQPPGVLQSHPVNGFQWSIAPNLWFLDSEKVIISRFLFFILLLMCQFGQKAEMWAKQTEAALEPGCCPGRTKLVVFYSHEVELVHILVGKNNERLTGTECAVEMLRWGREERGKQERRKGLWRREWQKGKGHRVIDGPHTLWCKEGRWWQKRKQAQHKVSFCLWENHNRSVGGLWGLIDNSPITQTTRNLIKHSFGRKWMS